MALATISDVEARLGRPLTVEEAAKAEAWLVDASALFVQRSVQKFESGESTALVVPKNGIARLVQRPVVEIVSVEDINGVPVEYTWDGFQSIYDLGSTLPLKITYEHGSDIIPDIVVAVVAGMVVRTLQIPAGAASGISQQTVGPFSQTYATWAVGAQVKLSPADEQVAKSFAPRNLGTSNLLGNGIYQRQYPSDNQFSE